ncbi:tetratricopeptide repeat protein [Nocardioides sp. YIM 152588]|uniref:tetratricopeptide repeat protein n=1 Tax=Nocardioides sp. YIM 152588 TaxID=3158259 RepID=UPI0032E5104E
MDTSGDASGATGAAPAPAPDDLPALALSRPAEALRSARALAASTTEPLALSYAHQAAGIVLRDTGETEDALVELRAALAAARATRDADRVADVRATLGTALVVAGRTRTGLRQLETAARDARGPVRARVLMRRAALLSMLGRHPEALADMRRALAGIREAGDELWEARALNNRAGIHLEQGSLTRAERDLDAAERLFLATGQELESVLVAHNRGLIAYYRGDLPTALAVYDDAAARFRALDATSGDLAFDRCVALLAAGLAGEALADADAAVADRSVAPSQRAELLLAAALAALAAGSTPCSPPSSRPPRRPS